MTVILIIPLYIKHVIISHLINHGSLILYNTCFPVLICCMYRQIMECDSQRERMFWLCHFILIANMNVSDFHLNILDNLCCKLLHECIIWFWFIYNCIRI